MAFGPYGLKLDAVADPVHPNFAALLSYAPIAPEKLGFAREAPPAAKAKIAPPKP